MVYGKCGVCERWAQVFDVKKGVLQGPKEGGGTKFIMSKIEMSASDFNVPNRVGDTIS